MSAADLDALLSRARGYTVHSHAAHTLQNYAADWKHFTAWCADHGRRALPAAPETILCYVVALVDRYAVSTIERRLASISYYHKQARHPLPTKDPEVERTMRGIRREKGVAPKGKAPILLDTLRQMVGALPNGRRGLQDKAILLVGFAGAFRRSELVGLTVGDVCFVDEGMILHLRRSKTDQEGEGFSKGLPYGENAATCPVRALRRWLEAANITNGPLFRPIDRHGNIGTMALHSQGVVRAVKRAAKLIGLDADDLSGHSLRAGLATSAARAGVSERVIMAQTGHKDVRTVRRYIREGSLFRENAAGMVGL